MPSICRSTPSSRRRSKYEGPAGIRVASKRKLHRIRVKITARPRSSRRVLLSIYPFRFYYSPKLAHLSRAYVHPPLLLSPQTFIVSLPLPLPRAALGDPRPRTPYGEPQRICTSRSSSSVSPSAQMASGLLTFCPCVLMTEDKARLTGLSEPDDFVMWVKMMTPPSHSQECPLKPKERVEGNVKVGKEDWNGVRGATLLLLDLLGHRTSPPPLALKPRPFHRCPALLVDIPNSAPLCILHFHAHGSSLQTRIRPRSVLCLRDACLVRLLRARAGHSAEDGLSPRPSDGPLSPNCSSLVRIRRRELQRITQEM
ncbi:hypothetical protein R3P38DRAFT_3181046 [Favolaschia claudopus]|uniref:Uncharacterized protein n=1 Tax=Favolaschia claudopus TaxID=2862362 RepID=A0AAW0CJZ7_9AGAR